MISEWGLEIARQFVVWLSGLFGTWTPPDILLDPASGLRGFLQGVGGMGVWVDWGVLAGCMTAAVAVWVAVLGIKLVRALLAHVPGFGGAGD